MMVGADQLHVGGIGLVEQERDVVRRHDRTTPRPAVDRRIDALIMERDARILELVAVEQQTRRIGIDGIPAEAECLVELHSTPTMPGHPYLPGLYRRRSPRHSV